MNEQRRRDIERLSALLDAPHMNVAAIDYTYLRLIAQRLVVIAHAGYQREGRGTVVLGSPRNTMRRANTAGRGRVLCARSACTKLHPAFCSGRGLSGGALELVLSFGAAALLYLVTEELLVEAHEVPETPLTTAMFFLGFLVLLVIEIIAIPVTT